MGQIFGFKVFCCVILPLIYLSCALGNCDPIWLL